MDIESPTIPKTLQILQEACNRWGYSWKLLDEKTLGLVEVSDGSKTFYATNNNLIGCYPLNNHFISGLVRDKAWTYKVLDQKGYRIPKGEYFFIKKEHKSIRDPGGEFERAVEYAKLIGYPVFVKPNSLSGGTLAKNIENEEELRTHLEEISEQDFIAIVQEVITGKEFRIFALDGEIQFAYEKTGPIAAGGKLIEYFEEVAPETSAWVKKICDKLQIRVCGFDLFGSSINDPDSFTILELNNNPSLEGIYNHGKQEKALEVWKNILEKFFGVKG